MTFRNVNYQITFVNHHRDVPGATIIIRMERAQSFSPHHNAGKRKTLN